MCPPLADSGIREIFGEKEKDVSTKLAFIIKNGSPR